MSHDLYLLTALGNKLCKNKQIYQKKKSNCITGQYFSSNQYSRARYDTLILSSCSRLDNLKVSLILHRK